MKRAGQNHLRIILSLILLLGALGLPLLRLDHSVRAAPGQNGRIAYDHNLNIYTADPDGSNQVQITSTDTDFNPRWSPDGTKIAFSSFRDGTLEIYVTDADGSNQTRITDVSTSSSMMPSWSPDGAKIAFTNATYDICIMNIDGTGFVNLTSNPAADLASSWSPDGTKIAFTSDRDDPNAEIYVMDADGSNVVRLTNSNAVDVVPEWLPDGTRIAFTSDRNGGTKNLFTMDASGNNIVQLTSVSAPEAIENSGVWSPDGTKILFRWTDGDQVQLRLMDSNGSNIQSFTALDNTLGPNTYTGASWQVLGESSPETDPPTDPSPEGNSDELSPTGSTAVAGTLSVLIIIISCISVNFKRPHNNRQSQ